jgi:hypothetical protein
MVTAGKLWFLEHILSEGLRVCGPMVIWSVVVNNVCFKGDAGDEAVGAVGTLVIVWKACVKVLQDGVVRPIGAIVATESVMGS